MSKPWGNKRLTFGSQRNLLKVKPLIHLATPFHIEALSHFPEVSRELVDSLFI